MVLEIIDVLHGMADEELDCLPFGLIYLDCMGMVLRYNATESRLSGRKPEDVIGKLFFTEVAPCTAVPEFSGRFYLKVRRELLDEHFTFVFSFRSPRTVRIHMLSGLGLTAWIFITDVGSTAEESEKTCPRTG